MEEVAEEHKIAYEVFEREAGEEGSLDIDQLAGRVRKKNNSFL